MRRVALTLSKMLLMLTFVVALGCVMSQRAYAAEITVDATCTLADAIIAANTNDDGPNCVGNVTGVYDTTGIEPDFIVLEVSTTYTYVESWGDPLNMGNAALPPITSTIAISGNNSTLLRESTFSCPATLPEQDFRFFNVHSEEGERGALVLLDLTLTNGCANGVDSGAQSGGAIRSSNSEVVLLTSNLLENNALGDGGAIASVGFTNTVTLSETLISGNHSEGNGGAIYAIDGGEGSLVAIVSNISTLRDNHSEQAGGGIYANSVETTSTVTVVLFESLVELNSSVLEGGGLYVASSGITSTNAVGLVGSTIISNTSGGDGGGVYNLITGDDTLGGPTIAESEIISNTSQGDGGGFYFEVTGDNCCPIAVALYFSVLYNNRSGGDGGGFYALNSGTDTIMGSEIVESAIVSNTSQGEGGGFYVEGVGPLSSVPTVVQSAYVVGNHSQGDGGGIYVKAIDTSGISTLFSIGSDIFDNSSDGNGGGLYWSNPFTDTLLIQSAYFFSNAADDGGAIYAETEGGIISDSCITGNYLASLRYTGITTMTAQFNWWGAPDGPSGDFPGHGDPVFGNVDVSDFMVEVGDGTDFPDCFLLESDVIASAEVEPPDDAPMLPGQPVTFTTFYTNTGLDVAYNLQLTETVISDYRAPIFASFFRPALPADASNSDFVSFFIAENITATHLMTFTSEITSYNDPNLNPTLVLTRSVTMPTVSLSESSVSVEESDDLELGVELDFINPYADSKFILQTSDGSATSVQDYTAISQTFTIPKGQQSVTVTIPISDDSALEIDETFFVTLSVDGGLFLGTPNTATLTILANDVIGALVVGKEPNSPTVSWGDTITYTYRVTNTGTLSLTNLVAVDDLLGEVTLIPTTLDPNEVATGTLVTTADNPGLIVNTVMVTATAQPLRNPVTGSDTASVTVIDTRVATIVVDKQASAPTVNWSDTVTYTYRITNTGNVSLTGIIAVDNLLGAVTLNPTTLEPNEAVTGTLVTSADDPGTIINTVTVSGTSLALSSTVTDTDQATVNVIDTRMATMNVSKEASSASVNFGEPITYTYRITNTGNVELTGLIAGDDLLGEVTLDLTTLQPNDVAQGTLVITADEPGIIVNTVYVTATAYSGEINDNAEAFVEVIETRVVDMDVSKEASSESVNLYDTITYTYRITNTGNVSLTGLIADDDLLGAVSLDLTMLEPNEMAEGTLVITANEPGTLINAVFVTATAYSGEINRMAEEDVQVIDNREVNMLVSKQVHSSSVNLGDLITYTYRITNTGNVSLTGILADDDLEGGVPLDKTTLQPGEAAQGILEITADEAGLFFNTVYVTATAYSGEIYRVAQASVTVVDNRIVSMSVSKEANSATVNLGDTITYTYRITNTGNVSLTEILATDDLLGEVALDLTTLQFFQVAQGILTTTTTSPGTITNTVYVTATAYNGQHYGNAQEMVEVIDNRVATLLVSKEPNSDSVNLFDTITYTYRITNTGNVSLTGLLADDNLLGGVPLDLTTLQPNDVAEGTLTTTAEDPGTVVNTVYVSATAYSGEINGSADASVEVIETRVASLLVSKVASSELVNVGDSITYTYRVTNTGDVDLSLVAHDNLLGAVSLIPATIAPDEVATGQRVTTASTPGTIINTVTVTGTSAVLNESTTDDAQATVEVVEASLSMLKTIGIANIRPDCTNLTERQVPVGTTVIYCYTVTNKGNVPLTNHSLTDDQVGPIAVDSDFVLLPGQSISRTITQTIPASVTNIATWTAEVDEGATVALYSMDQPFGILQVLVAITSQARVNVSDDDDDQDGDGIPDNTEGSGDLEDDDLPNFLDDDSDGDGRLDETECSSLPCRDSNGDGIPDFLDPNNATNLDPTEQPQQSPRLLIPIIKGD